MSEPATALEQRIEQLEPRTAKHVVVQTVAVLGLAVAGVGVALALNAPALPVRSSASAMIEAQAIAPPSSPAPTPPAALPPATAEVGTIPGKKSKPVSKASSSNPSGNTEASMNKSRSIAVTVAALGAAAVTQAQTPNQALAADSGRQASTAQIIASNDLDKDGIVTKEEATTADKPLNLMWTFYDRDGDGRVTAAEIDRATNAMMVATAEEKITGQRSSGPAMVKPDQVIANNDQNGDGIVTKEEATKVGGGLARLWQIYDLDKDGKVDVAEIAKAQNY